MENFAASKPCSLLAMSCSVQGKQPESAAAVLGLGRYLHCGAARVLQAEKSQHPLPCTPGAAEQVLAAFTIAVCCWAMWTWVSRWVVL